MCGVGFIAARNGRPARSVVTHALTMLTRMSHRGGTGADGVSGDGAGLLIDLPRALFAQSLALPDSYGVGMLFMQDDLRESVRVIVARAGFHVIAFRDVPINPDVCGPQATSSRPQIVQMFVETDEPGDLEVALYHLRRHIEKALPALYVCSLSSRSIVYKGLVQPAHLADFYPDLRVAEARFALLHQRFSTNTVPSWPRAHPYRMIAHNGEFNTIRGNVEAMRAREPKAKSPLLAHEVISPVIDESGSDSSMFDNIFEFAVHGGMSVERAATLLIPEAWEHASLDTRVLAYYKHQASLCEPWDGPAAVVFSDGKDVGAVLDRNGLRPARWVETADFVILSSEWGACDAGEILRQGRLKPGELLLVRGGELLFDSTIKHELAREDDYRSWSKRSLKIIDGKGTRPAVDSARGTRLFGYSEEDIRFILEPMSTRGEEPTGSMGNDTPLAVFSDQPQPLFSYFRQLFAQVTNPPIDAIREEHVTSLAQILGPRPNLFSRGDATPRIWIESPILADAEVAAICASEAPRTAVIDICGVGTTPGKDTPRKESSDEICGVGTTPQKTAGFAQALQALAESAEAAVRAGAGVLVLSDRAFSPTRIPIPSLLALAAVHQHLLRVGMRSHTSLVVESGEPREVMHMCLLIGCGADAVAPYLAQQLVADPKRLRMAFAKGVKKVMSKMGIATVRSYTGAQIFEALGLTREMAEKFFPAMPARLHAHGLERFAHLARANHASAYGIASPLLPASGAYQWRRAGMHHAYGPESVPLLQHAVRSGDEARFGKYSALVDKESAERTIRGRLEFKAHQAIALDTVEPARSIVQRFKTGAMSLGSISTEAHETLARAMNHIGGKSNTGEGGEDPARFGTSRRSAIKQVASGRFGVTVDYLVNADELQIKMAQGAKPGEGGQLPADKVDNLIARLRCASPGISLISPPPHHDIYSIEDLAQLIFDLKQVNPSARVSVKLVAEAGVGTIAAGVAKAGADTIVISGDSGGTGAAPLSSIKHVGVPWELGLADTQQALRAHNLRSRVRLETDGQLKTGRDVAIACLLGAEEFAFATAALIASGCVMMRVCHLNTCPVGIATQDPVLRERFAGEPEHIINFMFFIAEELREIMAQLGFRTVSEMVGQVGSLHSRGAVDLSGLLADGGGARLFQRQPPQVIATPWSSGIENRSVGTFRAGERARAKEVTEEQQVINGVGGQSFGAFLGPGLQLQLTGPSNDYFGKGLSGGRLIALSDIGNVALYGATSGEAFIRGSAGERFAVRNSGAVAVVQNVGDHGCEYMTRGVVVVLGEVGRNFAAGMSGGVAYVLRGNVVHEDSVLTPLSAADVKLLKHLLHRHVEHTQSATAWRMLAAFGDYAFRKVVPRSAAKERSARGKSQRLSHHHA